MIAPMSLADQLRALSDRHREALVILPPSPLLTDLQGDIGLMLAAADRLTELEQEKAQTASDVIDGGLILASLIRRAEQAEADLVACQQALVEAQQELDGEQKAHDAIGTICFKAGADTADGTSTSAVESLVALLATVTAQRDEALRAIQSSIQRRIG